MRDHLYPGSRAINTANFLPITERAHILGRQILRPHSRRTHSINNKTAFTWMPLISAPRVAPMLCCSPKKSLSSYVAAGSGVQATSCMRLVVTADSSSEFLLDLHTSLHMFSCSEVGALRRLRQLLVGGSGHVSSDLDEHGLHGEVAFPVCYAGELGEVDLRG